MIIIASASFILNNVCCLCIAVGELNPGTSYIIEFFIPPSLLENISTFLTASAFLGSLIKSLKLSS